MNLTANIIPYTVYWIRHPDHTDMTCEGYIGITKNYEKRLIQHNRRKQNRYLTNVINKYGWDFLIKEQLVIGDKEYCLDLEVKLRPKDKIGWNLVRGGGIPPSSFGRRYKTGKPAWNKGLNWDEEVKEKVSKGVSLLWSDPEYRQRMSDAHKGKPGPRLGKTNSSEHIEKFRPKMLGRKQSPEVIEKRAAAIRGRKSPIVECPHCGKTGGKTGMKSWHFDNCRNKGN